MYIQRHPCGAIGLKRSEQGAQIDLLIDRQDLCINVCEMKFSISDFEITKGYAKELESKLKVFRDNNTQTHKTLFLTMVTTHGVKNIKNCLANHPYI